MTAFMAAAHRALPHKERYALPPRLIAENAADHAGFELPQSEARKMALTLLAHFGYGAAMGAVYGLRPRPALPRRTSTAGADGALFGLVVWDVSYLGLLPAIGLLSPATMHPWRRNTLMIVAHLVWGLTLGVTGLALRSGRGGSTANKRVLRLTALIPRQKREEGLGVSAQSFFLCRSTGGL
jgi:hypothetical protein